MEPAKKTDNPLRYSGNIPQFYDKGLKALLLQPYAAKMASDIVEMQPQKILELSCGTGILTELLTEALHAITPILATDINPDMLEIAREKLKGNPGITWELADAMALPYQENQFDTVVSQFGVMFYENRSRAYRKIHEILVPGGVFIFNTWGSIAENPIIALTFQALQKVIPFDTPSFYSVPFGYFDNRTIADDLISAGFSSFISEELELYGYAANAYVAAEGLILGTPVYNEILALNPLLVNDVIVELYSLIRRKYGDYHLNVPLNARQVSCVKTS